MQLNTYSLINNEFLGELEVYSIGHAYERLQERLPYLDDMNLPMFISVCLDEIGEDLLDLPIGQRFVINQQRLGITTVVEMGVSDITVITVIDTFRGIYMYEGQTFFNITENGVTKNTFQKKHKKIS